MDDSRYTSALLKPDAHAEGKADLILHDIEENGLRVIYQKDLIIDKAMAKHIYADANMKPFFQASVNSLVGDDNVNRVTLLIVESRDGNARVNLQKVKGKSDETGIRFKYRRFTEEQLAGMDLESEEVKNELAKNRLHVPDSDELAFQLMFMLMNESEIQELEIKEPELFCELTREFEKYKGLHIELAEEMRLKRLEKTNHPKIK